MPELKGRRELFAQQVAAGRTYTQSARIAGYTVKACRFAGSRLMRNESVQKRVQELKRRPGTVLSMTELFDRQGHRIGFFLPEAIVIAAAMARSAE